MVEWLHCFGACETEHHGRYCAIRTKLLTTWQREGTDKEVMKTLVSFPVLLYNYTSSTEISTCGPVGDV